MKIDKRLLALGLTAVLAVSACSGATTSTAPSAAASFGGTYQPETPSSTISTRPPCAATITGLRQAIASIATRPNGSGSREGTAQTSAQA